MITSVTIKFVQRSSVSVRHDFGVIPAMLSQTVHYKCYAYIAGFFSPSIALPRYAPVVHLGHVQLKPASNDRGLTKWKQVFIVLKKCYT